MLPSHRDPTPNVDTSFASYVGAVSEQGESRKDRDTLVPTSFVVLVWSQVFSRRLSRRKANFVPHLLEIEYRSPIPVERICLRIGPTSQLLIDRTFFADVEDAHW